MDHVERRSALALGRVVAKQPGDFGTGVEHRPTGIHQRNRIGTTAPQRLEQVGTHIRACLRGYAAGGARTFLRHNSYLASRTVRIRFSRSATTHGFGRNGTEESSATVSRASSAV